MNLLKTPFLVLAVVVVLGCQSTTRKAAVISSDQDRKVIGEAIAKMLFREDILLAQDAFSRKNDIRIFRTQKSGRELATPDIFTLWLEQNKCVLVHTGNNKVIFPQVNCQEL